MQTIRTKTSQTVYSNEDFDVEVRDVELPDGSEITHTVVLRDSRVVILPLQWKHEEFEVLLLTDKPYDAVDDPYVTEVLNGRLPQGEHDPYLVANRICGGVDGVEVLDKQRLLMSDVTIDPEFTSSRWHIICGYLRPGVTPPEGATWRPLRMWLGDITNGLIRDGKTMLALLMLQRWVEQVARDKRVGL